jgi:phosphate/phosphite/phosphonate ABC transporter binding protein
MDGSMSVSPARPLTFAFVPHLDDDRTRAGIADVAEWLGNELGTPVIPRLVSSPAELAGALASGGADFAWMSPTLFLTVPGLSRTIPLVCAVRQGVAFYHSVLFTRQSAPYRSPTELAGARAAWVAPTSAAGYIFPRLALASYGLDPRALFSSETFFDSHGAVVLAVLEERADVGATYAMFEGGNASRPLVSAGFTDAIPGAALRVLYAAGPISADAIVAAPNVPPAAQAAIVDAFLRARDAAAIRPALRHVFQADTFQRLGANAFEDLRAQIDDGRALGLIPDD